MHTYIAPIGSGLGDLAVSLPAIQWLVAAGEPTVLVVRSGRQAGFAELIPGLSGLVDERDLGASMRRRPGRLVNLRDHPLQRESHWGSSTFRSRYPQYRISEIVAHIARDYGIAADFHSPCPLPYADWPEAAGKVLLIPGSHAPYKLWTGERWLKLAADLASGGRQFAVIGLPDRCAATRELVQSGLPWLDTGAAARALSAVSLASLVVSVDTGLMHLAVHQGTKTVTLYANNPGSLPYVRTARRCLWITSTPCAQECVADHLQSGINEVTGWQDTAEEPDGPCCHLPAGRRCMEGIGPDEVLALCLEALAR